jgi:hypothetical protein
VSVLPGLENLATLRLSQAREVDDDRLYDYLRSEPQRVVFADHKLRGEGDKPQARL